MNFIIHHNRFKKKINKSQLVNYLPNDKRLIQFPQYVENYYNFFNNYAAENYKWVKTSCLCGDENDILLSLIDRFCVDFITAVCKNCGLIRAKYYLRDEDVNDFYQNHYRTSNYKQQVKKPKESFEHERNASKSKYNLLNKHKIKDLNDLKIVDLGGGAGGALDHFNNTNFKYLLDYFDPYLEYASNHNIITIKGGLDNLNFKPDIIILSHVIEHWNNFEIEIEKLIKVQKKNQTLNYIEFPGIDSLKKGRRGGDVLGDLCVPHVYYFTSYVFENLMNRYGFEKIYLDTEIKSIFIYTGEKKCLINFYNKCYVDLKDAEKTRKIQITKNVFKKLIPSFILKIVRKFKNNKIKF